MVRVQLRSVKVDLQSNTPVLLLQEEAGEGRTLPIFIGTPEATAIAFALQGVEPARPMTHDLLVDVIEELGAVLEHVEISELDGATYLAELVLVRDGNAHTVSARPSDAVALAVRTGSPLFVADHLMELGTVTIDMDDDDDVEPEEVVDQFRHFLDTLSPEDFSD
jgi:bifunctional DNase/RNase